MCIRDSTYPYVGSVRMRIIMSFNSPATSGCGTIYFGQVEDYSLNVKASNLAVAENGANKVMVYPNPVKDILSLSLIHI